MSLTHLHLMLNHVPVVGMLLVIALLAVALMRRSNELAKATFGVAVALALVSVVVFLTGEPAEESVENLPGVSEAVIEAHEEAALFATIVIGVFGAAALGALAWFRRRAIPRWIAGAGLAAALVVGATMAWTANLGGEIRHSEIRSSASITAGTGDAGEDEERERDD